MSLMPESTYIVILTCKNGIDTIAQAIQSWQNQTVKPLKIIVIDDGSLDGSVKIIDEMKKHDSNLLSLENSYNPMNPYDIKRLSLNWNKALELADNMKIQYDYHVIATEDTTYEQDYARKCLLCLNIEASIFSLSGIICDSKLENIKAPHGVGRFVRKRVFDHLIWKGRYPYTCGFESAILYEAQRIGYNNEIIDARLEHTRQLGYNHHFSEWPIASKLLGFSWLYTTGRMLLLARRKQLSLLRALQLSISYLMFKPHKKGFYAPYHKDLRDYIKTIGVISHLNPISIETYTPNSHNSQPSS